MSKDYEHARAKIGEERAAGQNHKGQQRKGIIDKLADAACPLFYEVEGNPFIDEIIFLWQPQPFVVNTLRCGVITHPPCALGELLIQDSDESR
jgi:hypothetical protein